MQDKKFLSIKKENDDSLKWYKLKGDGSVQYKKIEKEEVRDSQHMKGIIRRISKYKLITYGEKILSTSNKKPKIRNNERYSIEIEEAIINSRVVAAVDASVDERYIAALWEVITLDDEVCY